MPAVSAVLCLERENIVYTVGVNHFTADPNAQRTGEHLRDTKNNTLFDISWFRSPICNPNPHTIFDEIKLLARDLLGLETQNSHYKVFVSKNRHKNNGNTRPHVYIHSTHTLYKTCIILLPSYISDHESRPGVLQNYRSVSCILWKHSDKLCVTVSVYKIAASGNLLHVIVHCTRIPRLPCQLLFLKLSLYRAGQKSKLLYCDRYYKS